MSTPIEKLVLTDPLHWCRLYQLKGLWVELEPEHQRIIRAVNDFAGAITMPDVLGGKVLSALSAADQPVAVMAHPRADAWTFLSCTHDSRYDDLDLYAKLFRHYVRIAPRGSKVALPSPADADMHYREWIVEPGHELPTMAQLVDATLAAVR